MEAPNFNKDTKISELQDFQWDYDKEYSTHNKRDLTDIRHTLLHLNKLTGKMASFVEKMEHGHTDKTLYDQQKKETIPDLLYQALHLANVFNSHIEELYQKRIGENIKRIEEERRSET